MESKRRSGKKEKKKGSLRSEDRSREPCKPFISRSTGAAPYPLLNRESTRKVRSLERRKERESERSRTESGFFLLKDVYSPWWGRREKSSGLPRSGVWEKSYYERRTGPVREAEEKGFYRQIPGKGNDPTLDEGTARLRRENQEGCLGKNRREKRPT